MRPVPKNYFDKRIAPELFSSDGRNHILVWEKVSAMP